MVSLMGFDSGGLPGEADTGIFVQVGRLCRTIFAFPPVVTLFAIFRSALLRRKP
jgi:hypothetical protein